LTLYVALLPLLVLLLVVMTELSMRAAAQEQLITVADSAGAAAALVLGARSQVGDPSAARAAAAQAAELNGFSGPVGTLDVEFGRLRPGDRPWELRPSSPPNAVRVTVTRRIPSILAGWDGLVLPPVQAQSVARAR
jgi:hypothetical protein